MHPKLLTALKASIEKWKLIAEGKEVSCFGDSCALCKACNAEEDCSLDDNRERHLCPVFAATGISQCRHTPWMSFLATATEDEVNGGLRADKPGSIEAAQAEVKFLENLLPKNAK